MSLVGAALWQISRNPEPTSHRSQWRLDADLESAERIAKSWGRALDDDQSTQRILRQDAATPPAVRSADANSMYALPASERPTPLAAEDSSQSLLTVLLCELMVIAAFMILLAIEAEHSPHFLRLIGAAVVVSMGVIGATLGYWWLLRPKTMTVVAEHETTMPPLPEFPEGTRLESSSNDQPTALFQKLSRATRPEGWE